MYLNEMIVGKYTDLKSIDESDAEFTMNLRNDPEMGKYLPLLHNTLEQQKAWIRKQRETPGDYFWVMLDKNGVRFGTAGVYDINSDRPMGRSLAAKGNPLENIEGAYMAYKYALEVLHAKGIYGYVYAENKRAARFNQLLGAWIGEPTDMDGRQIREVIFKNPEFQIAEKKVRKILYRK